MGDIATLVPRASAFPAISLDQYAQMLQLGAGGLRVNTTMHQDREEITADFAGLVIGAYRTNPIVFALELKRIALFGQARFKFRRESTGELFGNPSLRPLEHPEVGETTQDLLERIILSADFGGDAFIVRRPTGRLVVPRPDWVTLILGSPNTPRDPSDPDSLSDLDLELVGIAYHEGGLLRGGKPKFLLRNEFAHFAPIRDPLMRFRGIPWPIAAMREIMADKAASLHKLQYFENAATPNLVVTLDKTLALPKAREWIELFEQDHKGVLNAYKTIYLGGGAEHNVVGANLRQMDFKTVQGAGQTVIAAASGIHPAIAALSEGLQGSTLNSGNFHEAKQLTGDTFLRYQWGNLAGSLEVIVPPPEGAALWYDESGVSFLKEDVKDAAEVLNKQATAIRTLTDGGYKPDTVVSGVVSGNLSNIKHAGYLPVQVQPIQADAADESDPTRQAALESGPALLAAGESFEVRCPGSRKDGSPCNALLGKRPTSEPVGFERKCERCGEIVAA
jgi:hypothetical protein